MCSGRITGRGGINLDHVYFIDAITKYAIGKESKGAENCTFVNNPSNLTDMGIAVTELLKHIEGGKRVGDSGFG
ncbi:hypothetical protein [Methanogenium cariaci]|uniref:hypothetical protein n=1 Tax=Methanogenium cariaci TaxID=2197 RepID=UPI001FE1F917|nr:hypothetical protein [Methanogenium cariaci]